MILGSLGLNMVSAKDVKITAKIIRKIAVTPQHIFRPLQEPFAMADVRKFPETCLFSLVNEVLGLPIVGNY